MKRFAFAFVLMVSVAAMLIAQTTANNVSLPPRVNGAQSAYVLYNTPLTTGHASISATTLITTPTTGTYRITYAASLTAVGASCAATSSAVANIIYQDPAAASGQTVALATFTTTGTNGTLGTVAETTVTSFTFRSLVGKAIQVSTTYTAGSMCSPGPNIQITPVLESLGS